jgi:hypothetical protein
MAEGGPPAAAASSSYGSSDVNEQYLASLVEMGIHRDDARQVLQFYEYLSVKNKSLFQALRLVNNRSLEDALAVVFGETPVFSADSTISTNGASIEQATQVSYESVGRIVFHKFS